ncbi:hypothetical protein [Salmonirosea aquatica]|uniref:Uncharacterized protein n=1 Tax=Salmonirosea aquatica TaxID=2654236 RepID=A0A7C9BIU8_9BACT|nr:hypothetical protein [Cytophagaceae bacterium SJW1-29]
MGTSQKRLQSVLKDMPYESIQDFIAILQPTFSLESFKRFGDPNNLTPGLRRFWIKKTAKGIDLAAAELKEFSGSNRDEDTLIQDILEFAQQYDTNAKLQAYVRRRVKEGQSARSTYERQKIKDVDTFVKNGLRTLRADTFKKELAEVAANPRFYFGPLLEIPESEGSFWALTDDQQTKFATQALQLLKGKKLKGKKGRAQNAPIKLDAAFKMERLARVAQYRAQQASGIVELAKEMQRSLRNPKSAARDAKRTSKKVFPATEAGLLAWAANPGKGDILGVDG